MNDEQPKNPLEFLFGPPPSAQERTDHAKRRQSRWKNALPHIKAARAALRELATLGFTDQGGRVQRASKHLAILQDDVETALIWPEEP